MTNGWITQALLPHIQELSGPFQNYFPNFDLSHWTTGQHILKKRNFRSNQKLNYSSFVEDSRLLYTAKAREHGYLIDLQVRMAGFDVHVNGSRKRLYTRANEMVYSSA